MNGAQHFSEAERLLGAVETDGPLGERYDATPSWAPSYLAAAQVHATLALTAAYVLSVPIQDEDDRVPAGMERDEYERWAEVAG